MDVSALIASERRLEFEALALAVAGRLGKHELPPDDAYHWTRVLCVMLTKTFPDVTYTGPPPENPRC